MKKTLLILLMLWTVETIGCQCTSHSDFLETVENKAYGLVIGKIIRTEDHRFQFSIDRVLNGSFPSDTIDLLQPDGSECGQNLRMFDPRKPYIFSLNDLTSSLPGYFELIPCASPALEVVGNKLRGRISAGLGQDQEMLLSDFLEIYAGKTP
ncbi:hypothetical protein [Pontibacter sp. G13]|uniref:hypothetical protein n=1 Tax=Pontibacter sp. G13 TaxID=3074898 RepID=UPI00288A8060|nr:hypothetical protein [Pontibacter sp. G13]WNJ17131.1 hypothetical protein RJD25_19930 [Pontibacter sp. G13]